VPHKAVSDYPRKGSGTSRVKPLSINSTPSTLRPALKLSKDRLPIIRYTEANTIAIWRNAWLQSKYGSLRKAMSRSASNALAFADNS
jgi:hypothetical protein